MTSEWDPESDRVLVAAERYPVRARAYPIERRLAPALRASNLTFPPKRDVVFRVRLFVSPIGAVTPIYAD